MDKKAKNYNALFAENGDTVIDIDGTLDSESWFGYSLRELMYDLSYTSGPIRIRLNSPGGDLIAGTAIGNALRSEPRTVTVEIIGICASAATKIAEGANRVLIHAGAYYMIHNPSTVLAGEAKDMESTASTMRNMESGMAQGYAAEMRKRGKYTDLTDEEITAKVKKWMNDETWFTAAQAVEHGFADEVIPVSATNSPSAQSDTAPTTDVAQGAITSLIASGELKTSARTPLTILNLANNMSKQNDAAPPITVEAQPVVTDSQKADLLTGFMNLFNLKPKAETVTEPETIADAIDPIEAAKALLLENGYAVEAAKPDAKPDAAPVATPLTFENFAQFIASLQPAATQPVAPKAAVAANVVAAKKLAESDNDVPSTKQSTLDAIRAKAALQLQNLANALKTN